MKIKFNKLIIILLGMIISFLGIRCTTDDGDSVLYGAPQTPFARISGKVIDKSSIPQKIINGIQINWTNQVNVPHTLSGSDGTFNIYDDYKTNIPSINYIIEAQDIDGISNGGLYLTFSTSGTLQIYSADYGENYSATNILIEMSKSN